MNSPKLPGVASISDERPEAAEQFGNSRCRPVVCARIPSPEPRRVPLNQCRQASCDCRATAAVRSRCKRNRPSWPQGAFCFPCVLRINHPAAQASAKQSAAMDAAAKTVQQELAAWPSARSANCLGTRHPHDCDPSRTGFFRAAERILHRRAENPPRKGYRARHRQYRGGERKSGLVVSPDGPVASDYAAPTLIGIA